MYVYTWTRVYYTVLCYTTLHHNGLKRKWFLRIMIFWRCCIVIYTHIKTWYRLCTTILNVVVIQVSQLWLWTDLSALLSRMRCFGHNSDPISWIRCCNGSTNISLVVPSWSMSWSSCIIDMCSCRDRILLVDVTTVSGNTVVRVSNPCRILYLFRRVTYVS